MPFRHSAVRRRTRSYWRGRFFTTVPLTKAAPEFEANRTEVIRHFAYHASCFDEDIGAPVRGALAVASVPTVAITM